MIVARDHADRAGDVAHRNGSIRERQGSERRAIAELSAIVSPPAFDRAVREKSACVLGADRDGDRAVDACDLHRQRRAHAASVTDSVPAPDGSVSEYGASRAAALRADRDCVRDSADGGQRIDDTATTNGAVCDQRARNTALGCDRDGVGHTGHRSAVAGHCSIREERADVRRSCRKHHCLFVDWSRRHGLIWSAAPALHSAAGHDGAGVIVRSFE